MDALTSFIIVIIAITIQFSLYTIKRLEEPLEPNYLIDINSKKIKNYIGKYWKNAEMTNGRLAMIGFLVLIINYGFFGWIIPGFI
ncbi:chlorophyll a/b-binding protein [Prochlorococcus marinus]|uniref:chlorophyll a/b-binding protein n=1 Tax=Prochlorococcus marinus TaxID=1219 RepID=UPI001ADC9F2A|nr:chlorophyll a/b-binding protein [Prochlorococcus marinus]MBO8204299.1 high light inducible protein [Prochlorococcus marinus CUG1415]MBW3043598.1 high light inducible protein [Prochlorococcus marinus str. MU1415]